MIWKPCADAFTVFKSKLCVSALTRPEPKPPVKIAAARHILCCLGCVEGVLSPKQGTGCQSTVRKPAICYHHVPSFLISALYCSMDLTRRTAIGLSLLFVPESRQHCAASFAGTRGYKGYRVSTSPHSSPKNEPSGC